MAYRRLSSKVQFKVVEEGPGRERNGRTTLPSGQEKDLPRPKPLSMTVRWRQLVQRSSMQGPHDPEKGEVTGDRDDSKGDRGERSPTSRTRGGRLDHQAIQRVSEEINAIRPSKSLTCVLRVSRVDNRSSSVGFPGEGGGGGGALASCETCPSVWRKSV